MTGNAAEKVLRAEHFHTSCTNRIPLGNHSGVLAQLSDTSCMHGGDAQTSLVMIEVELEPIERESAKFLDRLDLAQASTYDDARTFDR